MTDESSGKTPIVPKFSSFKTKLPASTPRDEHAVTKDKDQDKDTRSERHRSARTHRSRHRHEEGHRHKSRGRSRSREALVAPQQDVPTPTEQTSSSTAFVIDTKGDPYIRKYGGIDKSHVPAYYRHGRGMVLGAEGRLVIHRDGPRDQFSLRMPGEGSYQHHDKDSLRSRKPRIYSTTVRLRAKKNLSVSDVPEDYLALRTSKKRKRNERDGSSSNSDEERPSYRSIEGKAKPQQDSDRDTDSDVSESDRIVGADDDEPLRWKSIQLNRQVKDHPEDIDSWLELANHQDVLLRAGAEVDQDERENQARSYAEIKVSMLESALSNASHAVDREKVLVELMREGVKVWNSKTAIKKWSEILVEQSSFALWKAHADFSASNITDFEFESLKKMLLDRLHSAVSRNGQQGSREDFAEAIYVFLRMTRFVHDSGYRELAVAAWQALLELNIFRPPELQSQGPAIEAFQDFWESEIPRIGDAQAQGWMRYAESGGLGDPPAPVQDDSSEATQSRDLYKSWTNMEGLRAFKAKMPARTMDEGNDDDPFRVVMFSDIQDMLFFIPESILPSVAEQLIDAFLLFSGYPPAFKKDSWTKLAWNDQFLTTPLHHIDINIERKRTDTDIEFDERPAPYFTRGGTHGAISPQILFAGANWFRYIPDIWHDSCIDLRWMRNALQQLVQLANIGDLAQYYLAVSFTADTATIKKTAKALLKQYPTNARLYNAYSLVEFCKGNSEVANKVITSALEAPSISSSSQRFLMFATWAWDALESGDLKLAFRRLCLSTDEKRRHEDEITPTNVLKVRQFLTSALHESLSSRTPEQPEPFAECLILLSYVTSTGCTEPQSSTQGNISAAMSTVTDISRELQLSKLWASASHERLLQAAARLLYFNASKGPFRRIYLRENLTRFIEIFPQNTIFLSLFEWADSSLRIVDDTRTLLDKSVLLQPQDCVSSRVFAIHHELAHGNVNTAEAAFEHAVFSESCKNSPAIWIAFIRFCYSQKKQLRRKAKPVFYRALRHCPWSKEVMMEAFVTLIHDMESDELRSVYNTMTSKGMRIHVDLEDFMEQRRKG